MSARTHIAMDEELRRRAHAKAEDLGISFSEYMRRLVARDLGDPRKSDVPSSGKPDISIIFDLIDEGRPTDIARDKDKLVAEAVWANYFRKVGRRRLQRRRK